MALTPYIPIRRGQSPLFTPTDSIVLLLTLDRTGMLFVKMATFFRSTKDKVRDAFNRIRPILWCVLLDCHSNLTCLLPDVTALPASLGGFRVETRHEEVVNDLH